MTKVTVKPVILHLVDTSKLFANFEENWHARNIHSTPFCGETSEHAMVLPVDEYMDGGLEALGAESAICKDCLNSKDLTLYVLGHAGDDY